MLIPITPEQAPVPEKKEDKYITYILDKDLVRFAKFAFSILAVLITVGVILYGVDLKQTIKEVDEANKNLSIGNKEMKETMSKIDSLGEVVQNVQYKVNATLLAANAALKEIHLKNDSASLLVISIRNLTPGQKADLAEIKNEKPESFRSGKLWKPGTIINIAFLNGSRYQKEKVQKFAVEWTKYANLTFNFSGSLSNSTIRISFKEFGDYSYLGTDCLAIPKGQLTMALGSVQNTATTTDEESVNILRQFGHVIGLVNETSNPNAVIPWDKEKVYADYQKMGWPRESVDNNVFKKYPQGYLPSKKFDPQSIMMMPVPAELTNGKFKSDFNTTLSSIDKEYVAELYPKQ